MTISPVKPSLGPELDLTRVGITGWSNGGDLSALAVLKRPDAFKVAVAGAPVSDLRWYDTRLVERFMGLPQEREEAYKSSLLTLSGPTHMVVDPVSPSNCGGASCSTSWRISENPG